MNQDRPFGVFLVTMMLIISLLIVGHTQEKKLRIVYSSPSLEFSWLAVAAKTAKEEAQKLNVELIVQDGQGSSPKQSSDLRNAVSQGVDGIVLDPNDVRALTAAVNDVLESGIPVVRFDRYFEGASTPVPFFCLDNVTRAMALAP